MRVLHPFGLAAILLGALAFTARGAEAGAAYDYTITHTGGDKEWRIASAVEVEGAQQRVSFSEVTGYMAQTAQSDFRSDAFAFAGNGDAVTFYYPAQKQVLERHYVPGATWKQRQQVEGDVTKGITVMADDARVNVRDLGDGGAIDGMPTHKVEIQVSFTASVVVGSYKTSGKHEYVTQVWSTDRIDPSAAAFIVHRQFRDQMPDEVNRLVAQRDKFAGRFVLRRVTRISVPIGGKIVTTTTEEAVSNYRTAAIDAARFAVPAGFEPAKHAPLPPR